MLKRVLDKLFRRDKLVIPKISDEERIKLADDIRVFWKNDVWLKVLKPFTEERLRSDIMNLINSGTQLTNEEKNAVIQSCRATMAFERTLQIREAEGVAAVNRLVKKSDPTFGAQKGKR